MRYDTKITLYLNTTNQSDKLPDSFTFYRHLKFKREGIYIIACVCYLVQLYELGVGPRHLDGYLHYVLLLWHVDTS